MKSFVVPPNIGELSDAQIFRLARKVASFDGEIAKIEAELKTMRAQANATKADVKRTNAKVAAVTGAGPIGQRASVRLSAGGVNANGVKLNGRGFSVSGGVMRGLGPAFYVFGAAQAIGGIARKWREEEETRQLFGASEVAGRASAAIARTIFSTFSNFLADTLGEVGTAIAGFAGPDAAQEFKKFVEDFRNLPKGIRTEAETIERQSKARLKAAKFEVDELIYLENYTPPNITVGSSRELKSLREQLIRLNQPEISNAKMLIYTKELEAMD